MDGLRPLEHLHPLRKIHLAVEKIQDIDVVAAQHVEQVGHQRRMRADLHARAQLAEFHQNRRQDADQMRLGGADAQPPRHRLRLLHRALCPPHSIQNLKRMGQQPLPRLRERHMPAHALEKLRA